MNECGPAECIFLPASGVGQRFYGWQLAQTPEESWKAGCSNETTSWNGSGGGGRKQRD